MRHTTRKPLLVACPTCGKRIPWSPDNPWRPFCSERCRLIDLGEWLGEGRRIPGEPVPGDEDDTNGDS
ncbi:MAG: DNA gyrase inhibitor YacG [Gammaproteobacteria bacterium]|nr:DNA gyrase inhibitor YacG [Gammaproteobacteria bacterium]